MRARANADVELQKLDEDEGISSGIGDNKIKDCSVRYDQENDSKKSKTTIKAYLVVVGSFMVLLVNFGLINSIGTIQSYLTYHQLQDVPSSTVSWIFSVYMFFSFVLAVLVGPWFVLMGVLGPFICGTICLVGGLMAAANSTEVWQYILSFMCVGIGHSINITPAVSVVSQYWVDKALGTTQGIASMGGSVGGVFIPLMLRSLFPRLGYTWAMRILGFFCLGCMSVSILIVKEKYRLSFDQLNKDNGAKGNKLKLSTKNLLEFNALRDIKYVYLILGVFFAELSYMLAITFFASYAVSRGMSESASFILLMIFNSCAVAGRLVPGHAADHVGAFNVMIITLIGLMISIFVIWLPFGDYPAALYIFAVFFGLFSGSILSLLPAALGSIPVYTKKKMTTWTSDNTMETYYRTVPIEFGQKYGLLYFFVSVGNLFGIPVGGAIIGDQSKYRYNIFVAFSGLMCFLALAFWILSRYCLVGSKLNKKI